jgi:uncharacterized membrane protein
MEKSGKCSITGKEYPLRDLVGIDSIRPHILELIRKAYPDWPGDKGMISEDILNTFRNAYVQQLIEEETGDMSKLDFNVLESIKNEELLLIKLQADDRQKLTAGERVADKVATFGGSWRFIIIFGLILFVWITVNSYVMIKKPFDPFPFILLNLILSCLAAIQAPVIMMSQNRQESKDRARAQNDYQVNLKAEIEIRQLHEKIDHLLINQSKKLFEIQEIQIELMEQIMKNK